MRSRISRDKKKIKKINKKEKEKGKSYKWKKRALVSEMVTEDCIRGRRKGGRGGCVITG